MIDLTPLLSGWRALVPQRGACVSWQRHSTMSCTPVPQASKKMVAAPPVQALAHRVRNQVRPTACDASCLGHAVAPLSTSGGG